MSFICKELLKSMKPITQQKKIGKNMNRIGQRVHINGTKHMALNHRKNVQPHSQ